LPDCVIVIAQVKAEIERVERRRADAADASCKAMAEAMALEKRGMKHTHGEALSMPPLRGPTLHAKEANPGRAWSSLVHRFPSAEWAEAYRTALNNNPAYRDAGKCWTFGTVAIIVLADPTIGLARDVGVVLDVHGGECRAATYVEAADRSGAAEFTFVASYTRWQEVIEGKLDPIKGLMEGKVKLGRGHLPTIVRFVEAARQLVVSASKVPTSFV
jgi:putative sterol carrier protein